MEDKEYRTVPGMQKCLCSTDGANLYLILRIFSANPWDGTLNGKLLPTDSYHYILHLNDGSEPRSGVISIIR